MAAQTADRHTGFKTWIQSFQGGLHDLERLAEEQRQAHAQYEDATTRPDKSPQVQRHQQLCHRVAKGHHKLCHRLATDQGTHDHAPARQAILQ